MLTDDMSTYCMAIKVNRFIYTSTPYSLSPRRLTHIPPPLFIGNRRCFIPSLCEISRLRNRLCGYIHRGIQFILFRRRCWPHSTRNAVIAGETQGNRIGKGKRRCERCLETFSEEFIEWSRYQLFGTWKRVLGCRSYSYWNQKGWIFPEWWRWGLRWRWCRYAGRR